MGIRASTTVLLVNMWLLINVAHGQIVPDSTTATENGARHRFVVGLRYGTFGQTEVSFSGKYFLTSKAALHTTVGRVVGGGQSPSAAIFYERYRPLFRLERLRYFYGIGLNGYIPEVRGETKLSNIIPYAGATLGVEYRFKTLPLAIGMDFRQMFRLSQTSSGLSERHNLAVLAHYLLK